MFSNPTCTQNKHKKQDNFFLRGQFRLHLNMIYNHKTHLKNLSQIPNAAESLQMTRNPYLIGGSSILSNKPFMVFTVTDPEYSVRYYLNGVTANKS